MHIRPFDPHSNTSCYSVFVNDTPFYGSTRGSTEREFVLIKLDKKTPRRKHQRSVELAKSLVSALLRGPKRPQNNPRVVGILKNEKFVRRKHAVRKPRVKILEKSLGVVEIDDVVADRQSAAPLGE